jgi:hypothetical protein
MKKSAATRDYLEDWLVWNPPRWERNPYFWVAVTIWLTLVGISLMFQNWFQLLTLCWPVPVSRAGALCSTLRSLICWWGFTKSTLFIGMCIMYFDQYKEKKTMRGNCFSTGFCCWSVKQKWCLLVGCEKLCLYVCIGTQMMCACWFSRFETLCWMVPIITYTNTSRYTPKRVVITMAD